MSYHECCSYAFQVRAHTPDKGQLSMAWYVTLRDSSECLT